MRSIILNVGVAILLPVFLIFSLFILFRGHDEPGGGFIAGLLGAAAFIFYGLAYEMEDARRLIRMDPLYILATGLAFSLIAALMGIVVGKELLYPFWPGFSLPLLGTPGSPILFDIGIYLTVIGSVLKFVFCLKEIYD